MHLDAFRLLREKKVFFIFLSWPAPFGLEGSEGKVLKMDRPGADGNAPLLPAASPPVGEICSTLTLVLTEATDP